MLDLFAGTGNLGIEALSRGAASAVFVDKSSECSAVIKENLIHTKIHDKASIITSDIISAIEKLGRVPRKFDIIFADPPYSKQLLPETLDTIIRNDIIKDNGIIVAERDLKDEIPENVGPLQIVRNQKYGDTVLSFYKNIKSGQ